MARENDRDELAAVTVALATTLKPDSQINRSSCHRRPVSGKEAVMGTHGLLAHARTNEEVGVLRKLDNNGAGGLARSRAVVTWRSSGGR
jgi:hypothetical protein